MRRGLPSMYVPEGAGMFPVLPFRKKQAEVRDILWKFDISYEMRVSDRADFFVSGRTTSTDADIDHQTEYLIYVRKEDYDRAMFLVQRNLKE